MKAMIFAAGLGTRLRPLTNDRPKALVEVDGMPLLEIAIRRLKLFGVQEIIINIHHFGEQILDFLRRNDQFGLSIAISDERDLLLDTGGGLKKAAWFFNDLPFLVCNTDIITNLDLSEFYHVHLASGALATLAVQQRETSRYLLFDEQGALTGWQNAITGETRMSRHVMPVFPWAFSGIQVIHPDLFRYMPAGRQVFSIIDVYLEAAKDRLIQAYPHDEDFWQDVGKIAELEEASKWLCQLPLA